MTSQAPWSFSCIQVALILRLKGCGQFIVEMDEGVEILVLSIYSFSLHACQSSIPLLLSRREYQ